MDRGKNLSMAFSDLGEPDDHFASRWKSVQSYYGCSGGLRPGFAKWPVHRADSCGRNLSYGYDKHHGCYLLVEDRQVEVHFTGTTLDGTVFASTRENDSPMMCRLTQGNVMEGFSLAISSMFIGDKAVFAIPPELAMTKFGCPPSIPWNVPQNQTLRLDIELMSIITDVLDDRGVIKKIIKLGDEKGYPRSFDEVTVNYKACLDNGTSVSKSEGVEFNLTEGFFCPAFVHAVKTMTEGEEALVTIKPEYGFGERGRPSIGNDGAIPPNATLHINLHLVSWKTTQYIGENREILKKILRKTDPSRSSASQFCIMEVRLIGKLQDGTVFDRRGHDGQEPFEFITGKEALHDLDEAVLTMKEGEVASFTIPSRHGLCVTVPDQHQDVVVPPNSTLIYEIELLSVMSKDQRFKSLYPVLGACLSDVRLKERHEPSGTMIQVPSVPSANENVVRQPVSTAPLAAGQRQWQSIPDSYLMDFRPEVYFSDRTQIKVGHESSGRTIFVPVPAAASPTSRNASQHVVSSSIGAIAGGSSAAAQATVTNGSNTSTASRSTKNSNISRRRLGSCFGISLPCAH